MSNLLVVGFVRVLPAGGLTLSVEGGTTPLRFTETLVMGE